MEQGHELPQSPSPGTSPLDASSQCGQIVTGSREHVPSMTCTEQPPGSLPEPGTQRFASDGRLALPVTV